MSQVRKLGVIGGLGSLAGADLFFKLIKSDPLANDEGKHEILFEQHPFRNATNVLDASANTTSRKLYVFQMAKKFEALEAESLLVPCFVSHTFLPEIAAEIGIPIIDMMDALVEYVQTHHPHTQHIGVLTSSYVRHNGLFERYFNAHGYSIVYPTEDTQHNQLMPAIYAPEGIKSGHLNGHALDTLRGVCQELQDMGATLILPGMTEVSIVSAALQAMGMPVVDGNQAYADYALHAAAKHTMPAFKLGIVGGVGPAATVDFMQKVIERTPAGCDQEHIKMVIEHNPQIPDRTANLLHNKTDPTIALYSTCKHLENDGAQAIAIPCNTAHAFVERIQPYLSIPIINMLNETVAAIQTRYPHIQTVGLLGTSGTMGSRVYHDLIEKVGLTLLTPDDTHQQKVMSAIYGDTGVKAGFTTGACQDEITAALAHLVERGAQLVILGCTELPLLLAQSEAHPIANTTVVLLDPTDVLAQRCVALAMNG